jgi:small subunit ribosomal protein S18
MGKKAVMAKKKRPFARYRAGRKCRFCRGELLGVSVDYKDIRTLGKLVTAQGKLFGRKRSGNCAKHQRRMKLAVKRARFLALMAYVAR